MVVVIVVSREGGRGPEAAGVQGPDAAWMLRGRRIDASGGARSRIHECDERRTCQFGEPIRDCCSVLWHDDCGLHRLAVLLRAVHATTHSEGAAFAVVPDRLLLSWVSVDKLHLGEKRYGWSIHRT